MNTTGGAGTLIKLHFDGACILTHHATDLILPSGANITTAAEDEAEFIEYASGDYRCTNYTKASGAPVKILDNSIDLGQIASGTDGELITWDASGDPAKVAVGTATHILTSNGAGAAPTFQAAAGGGKVQQIVYTLDGDDANGTGTIPFDNTIPQSSEGTEFMTRAITPTSASSVLRIDVHTSLTHSVSNMCIKTALFKDSVANALAVSWMHAVSGSNHNIVTCLTHHIVAGSTSSQTFKVRCGGSSGTTYFNSRESSPTGQMFGAITQSSITITEYTP